MDQEKVGRFIAALRKEKNLTQEQLAEKLGISNKTVSRWEQGKGFPDVSLLQELCELLDISVSERLPGEKMADDNFRTKVEENTIKILEACRSSVESEKHIQDTEKPFDLGTLGVLQTVFVILKLTGTVRWSWLWVLSPVWIGAALSAVSIIIVLVVMKKRKLKMPKIKIKFF